MSTILAAERETYAGMWSGVEDYAAHAPGVHYLPVFLSCIGSARRGVTVLDAGTGSGKGALALQAEGFTVRACDFTDAGFQGAPVPFTEACLWHDLSHVTQGFGHPGRTTADYVYCTDVLEHLPPPFTMLAVQQMLRVTSKGLFLTISLVPDAFGVWAGKALHQSVFSFVQWRDALAEVGEIIDARDLLNTGVFMVGPR